MATRTDQGDRPPRLPRPGRVGATLASLLLGLWIATGELGHLLGQLVAPAQRTWSPGALTGPLALAGDTATGWEFLGRAGHPGWLAAYGVLSALATLTGGALLLRAVTRAVGPSSVARVGRWGVLAGTAVGLVEDLLIALGGRLPAVLPFLSTAKWLGVGLGLLCLVVLVKPRLRGWVLDGVRAAYTHRYSVLVVLPLAALGIARGPDLLEQVPDIQRAWLDDGGWPDLVAAGAVTGLLVVMTFVIGRQRTAHLWARTTVGDEAEARPLLAVWLLGPALLLAAAVVVRAFGGEVGWVRLAVFSAVPLVVVVGTLLVRRLGWATRPPPRPAVGAQRFAAAAWLGDALPAALVVVMGLGAIRAYTGVLALGQLSAFGVVLLVAGWLTVLLTWPVHDRLLRSLGLRGGRFDGDPGGDPGGEHGGQRMAWLSLAGGVVAVVVVALLPVPLAHGLGVIATFQLALGALTLLIASVVILFQAGGAPEVFWLVRLRFVPVTTLVVGSAALAGLTGGAQVHAVRVLDPDLPERPTVSALFDTWLEDGAGCGTPVDVDGRSFTVRALPLYAAEGGGIRASYWTTAAIDRLQASAPRSACASAFLSSGASGGSVGLALASTAPAGSAAAATDRLTGPEALGAATDGLVLRDTIYAATGVPVPALFSGDHAENPWSDRATLIEKAWSAPNPDLDAPYAGTVSGTTGALVINSTSSSTACRTLLSQVSFAVPKAPGAGDCSPPGGAAATVDLLDCTGQLRTTTAALLTARFPYVTPSGVVRCDRGLTGARVAEQQIVDGGYAENTGIGTLVDLAPQYLDLVRAQNACALAGTCSPELVVPLLVYFDNGSGSDLLAQPRGLRLEIAVPPVTLLTARAALVSARAQLQRAEAAFAVGQLGLSADAADAVEDWRGNHATFVAYQSTEPGLAAPLGWVPLRRQHLRDGALAGAAVGRVRLRHAGRVRRRRPRRAVRLGRADALQLRTRGQGTRTIFPAACGPTRARCASAARSSGNVSATTTRSQPAAAASSRSARAARRSSVPGSAPSPKPSWVTPRSRAASLGTSVVTRSVRDSERSRTAGVPTASRTTSTPWPVAQACTSARKSKGSTPSSRSRSWSWGSAVPSTRAPRRAASWAANSPTPPAAPCSSTVSPSPTPPASTRCAAAVPVSRSPAACSQVRSAGLGSTFSAFATTRSAYAPGTGCTTTSSPVPTTTPAHSAPSRTGTSEPIEGL